MREQARDATRAVITRIRETRRRRKAPLVLELDLTEPLVEGVPHDPVTALMARRGTRLETVVGGLRRAGRDSGVKGVVVKLGGSRPSLGMAQAQELRRAVQDFRAAGKRAVAWAETFGEPAGGTVPYYLATAFDQICLQPSGDLGVIGVALQVPFLRDALENAGITVQIARRHEYKNAADVFTERRFTGSHREAAQRLVDSAMEQVVTEIAADRRLDPDDVRALVDRAPLLASEALEAGLVDRLAYRDEVYGDLRESSGDDAMLQYVSRYARSKRAQRSGASGRADRTQRPVVALVHVNGAIHLGRSGRHPLMGATTGADTVTAALRAAVKAENVRAIVLRVRSPGGSYVASDAVWREVGLARQAGKPVVVSMGDVAASGGYFVSMGADVIVAEPATITGSIGVLSGKPVVDRLAERIGIGHDQVTRGEHALMFSRLRRFDEDEWARLNTWLDRIYDDFVSKVAACRRLPVDRVYDLARGRVWNGADAKDRGLVDELGGLALAVELAREQAGLPPSADPELRTYPRRTMVGRLTPAESSHDAAAERIWVGETWAGFGELALGLGLPAMGPLVLPEDWRLR